MSRKSTFVITIKRMSGKNKRLAGHAPTYFLTRGEACIIPIDSGSISAASSILWKQRYSGHSKQHQQAKGMGSGTLVPCPFHLSASLSVNFGVEGLDLLIYFGFYVIFHLEVDLTKGKLRGRARTTCPTVPVYNVCCHKICLQCTSRYTVLLNRKKTDF